MNEPLIALIRSVVAFFSLFLITRLLGKQQISQLTFFEYATGITIGSIASEMSVDLESKGLVHWIGLLTWGGLTVLLQSVVLKHRHLAKLIDGEPVVVIQNGKIFYKNLRLLRYRIDDLLVEMRQKNVFDISEVEFAILEPSGVLTVQKKSQYAAVTPQDLNIPTQYKGLPTELIVDGEIIEQNLRQVNLDKEWLVQELTTRGISSPRQVGFASLNTQGELYISLFDDMPEGSVTDVSDYPGLE